MMFATKDHIVVAKEVDGKLDLSGIDYDAVITVDDDFHFDIGWLYSPPPTRDKNLIWFFDEISPKPKPRDPVYMAQDSEGNYYELSPEEVQAQIDGTWVPRKAGAA